MSKPTMNELIATGQTFRDYDPLRVLKELRAAVGYRDGYVINLGPDQSSYLYRLLTDTVAFHTGGDTTAR